MIFDRIIQKEEIRKGWSIDRKYCITASDGKKYLLRVSPAEREQRKREEFAQMQRVEALGVPICRPVEFGTCAGGVYSIQSWIDGEDAEEAVPLLPSSSQYSLGLEAGRILKQIHSVPAPAGREDWEQRFGRKIDRNIKMYRDCPTRYESGGEAFQEYIAANRHLLKGRPQCWQHGDYHIGNMMIDSEGRLWVIDFDRSDFGDPWEEFNRIVWCAQKSPLFASGMVNGYFDGSVPMEFWRLLALYIASNTLASLPWALPFGQDEVDTMQNQAKEVLQWYNGMKNPVPSWYCKGYYLQYFGNLPCKLRSPFDFSFLERYGSVFRVFDDQDSGNICFGVQKGEERYFVKFAGAPTERGAVLPQEAVRNLERTVPVYRALAHENLAKLLRWEKVGGGFAMIFQWEDGECMGRQYPAAHKRFQSLDNRAKLSVFHDILSFFSCTAAQGYVAVDFYDGSILYDSDTGKTTICDIDCFRRAPCRNEMGRMWGSSRFMSPEEFTLGAELDEVTNVYTLGATAFALFADCSRSAESWTLGKGCYSVAQKAVSKERGQRQQSIRRFIEEWETALR